MTGTQLIAIMSAIVFAGGKANSNPNSSGYSVKEAVELAVRILAMVNETVKQM